MKQKIKKSISKIREKKLAQALESIRKLEKRFEQDILQGACYKYAVLVRAKKSVLAKKKKLEEELEKLKGKI
jgi:hypothetical protein